MLTRSSRGASSAPPPHRHRMQLGEGSTGSGPPACGREGGAAGTAVGWGDEAAARIRECPEAAAGGAPAHRHTGPPPSPAPPGWPSWRPRATTVAAWPAGAGSGGSKAGCKASAQGSGSGGGRSGGDAAAARPAAPPARLPHCSLGLPHRGDTRQQAGDAKNECDASVPHGDCVSPERAGCASCGREHANPQPGECQLGPGGAQKSLRERVFFPQIPAVSRPACRCEPLSGAIQQRPCGNLPLRRMFRAARQLSMRAVRWRRRPWCRLLPAAWPAAAVTGN